MRIRGNEVLGMPTRRRCEFPGNFCVYCWSWVLAAGEGLDLLPRNMIPHSALLRQCVLHPCRGT